MGKPIRREAPTNHNLKEAQELRQRTQRASPQRQERLLKEVANHPEKKHTIESLSKEGAKSFEESLRNFFNVHTLLQDGRLKMESRLNPTLRLP